jgi:thiol-disulfide isomerase/thioredoxin
MNKTHYEVLGINKDIKSTQIKQIAQENIQNTKNIHEAKVQAIKIAWKIISNPISRNEYDLNLQKELIHTKNKQSKNHYQLLKVPKNVSIDLLKNIIKQRLNSEKLTYHQNLSAIKQAFDILNSEENRRVYDLQLETEIKERRKYKATHRRRKIKKKNRLLKPLLIILIISIYINYIYYKVEEPILPKKIPVKNLKKSIETTKYVDTITSNRKIIEVVSRELNEALLYSDKTFYEEEVISLDDYYYNWEENVDEYKELLSIATMQKLPFIVYFHVEWCKYCKRLKNEYLTDIDLNNFLQHIIKIKINPEKDIVGKYLFKKLGGKGYPSFFVYVPHTNIKSKRLHPFHNKKDETPAEFLQNIKKNIAQQYYKTAKELFAEKEYQDAVWHYSQAIQYVKDNYRYYFNLGLSYHRWGYEQKNSKILKKAKANYLTALQYNPDCKTCKKNLNILDKLFVKI